MHVVRIGIDGSFRVGADHLYCAVGSFLQIASGAGNGAASADARHEMRDLMVAGFPDFRTSGVVVAFRSVRVVVLVRAVSAGNRFGEAFRHLVVGARIIRTSIGRGYHHFCTVCAEYRTLGFGNLVWQGEDGAVSALLGHEGKSYAGVAGGRFHNHTARLEFAAAFGRVDDAFRNAVFGGAARIEIFDFDCDGGFDAVGHMVEFDERSVADELGKGVVDGHVVSLRRVISVGFR